MKKMKPKAYLLIFDGMADWEAAHALCEINKSGRYEVMTVGFSAEPISSMGGLRIVPETTIKDVNPDEACIFIMPGGDMWEQNTNEEITILLRRLNARQVLIGAICGATLAIARAGLTRECRHTSNAKEYLKAMVPDYQDEDFYADEIAVTDQKIITASGLGSVEFGREVIRALNLYSEADTQVWFEMFKHGVYPRAEAA
ncbi:MAG: DJ-1/PfpI family protein [Pyrinomonadaceae bacterium MAG19_C2-C3]|nr:DJ-1/PfpI family protein [Pyrinomonadaceae bacterium MAG19_C2-C3]